MFDQLDGDAARTDAHPARRQRLEQHRRIDDQNHRGKRHVQERADNGSLTI